MKRLLAIGALALTGCATNNSGVIATGADTYFVSRQSGNALKGMANLKAEAYGEAGQFCAAKGRTLQVVSENDAKPPYILGNYPKTEMQFKCV